LYDTRIHINRFPYNEYYITQTEVIFNELNREKSGNFNIIHQPTGLRADIYLTGLDSFNRWAIENYRIIKIGENNYRIASPEYVIIRKLEYYRDEGSDKHIRDIRSIIEIQSQEIDRLLLEKFIKERSLEKAWDMISW
jgi:hypothetical protein